MTAPHPSAAGPFATARPHPYLVSAASAAERAVLQAIAYADIFDYPLCAAEIHRYLIGVSLAEGELNATLDVLFAAGRLARVGEHYALPGREGTVATRAWRERRSTRDWPRAMHYGRLIASLPFVRMVAVTGELAMDNVDVGSDIDFFIVTAEGRVWTSRLLAVAVARYARPRGDVVCPNYLLASNALELTERNLYSAHEVAQMVPLHGLDVYRDLRERNGWVLDHLPNAAGPPPRRDTRAAPLAGALRPLAEAVLRTPAGDWIEQREMRRKIRKLERERPASAEVTFAADRCKGHFDSHGARILAAFDERCRAVEEQLA